MKIKPFNDFLATLTEEDMNNITDTMKSTTSEMIKSKSSTVGGGLASSAIAGSFEILSLYHQWLSEQLDVEL